MDTIESPQAAAERVACAQRIVEQGEEGLRLLQRSRAAFIHSLRATGLSHAQACIKYDNCLDEQRRLHQAAIHELQYAERLYQHAAASAGA